MCKRTNECFRLPVNVPVNADNELHDDRGSLLAEFTSRSRAKSAAHAINHADALADALGALLYAVTRADKNGLNDQVVSAAKVFNAYRGAK